MNCKAYTYAGPGGGSFPAVRDVGLVGVVGVSEQRAGGLRSAAGRAWFSQLDASLVFGAVVRRCGLTALRVSHPRRRVLTHCEGNGR